MIRLDLRRATEDARSLFRRDADLLLRLAGVFLFLPGFAGLLFLPPAVAEQGERTNQILLAWFARNAHWLAMEQAVLLLGGAALYRLYLDPAARSLGGAIQTAMAGFLPFLLAMLLATTVTFAGLMLLVLPGAYLLGRTALTGAAAVAEGRGPAAAVERSFRATRGHGWVLFGVQAMILFAGQFVVVLLGGLDPGDAGLLAAVVDAAAAATMAAATLATVLFKIAVWRQLGSSTGT